LADDVREIRRILELRHVGYRRPSPSGHYRDRP
jgi:hypothetical protein